MTLLTGILMGVLPVLLFLSVLRYMDSYRLTPVVTVLWVLAAGVISAVVALHIHSWVLADGALSRTVYLNYCAPFVEELCKGVVIYCLFRLSRIGFLVDAAILGFAVGTGFAVYENLYLLAMGPDLLPGVWLIRGLGTAVMHGGVAAIYAILAQRFSERSLRTRFLYFTPGLLIATVLHWSFNQFYFSPLVHTVLVVALLPILLVQIFRKSAVAMHEWLQLDFDSDAGLIEQIVSGEFKRTRAGEFLSDLRDRFEGPTLVDMLCYLRIYTELALRAKGVLMMRQHGFEVEPDDDVQELFAELEHLEGSIGKVGVLAMRPFLHFDHKDLWQLTVLNRKRSARKAGG
ncbi:PrsW family intramembrane metalloprotease [Marinobacter alexandrii]|uniref:PrsW family intramembrane metalloprotease n=1 Tax=Marinobacter alexandrii TaxID=2570351 RepID=UPI0032992993